MLARRVIVCFAMTVPALCAAQHDPASRGAPAPANPGSTSPLEAVRDLFDWLLGPRDASANASTAPAPGTRSAGPPAGVPDIAAPAASPAPARTMESPALPIAAAAVSGTSAPAPADVTAAIRDAAVPPATGMAVARSGIALILPAKTSPFGRAAEVARQGFMAARAVAADMSEVHVFETDGSGDSARAAFARAVASNASVIVGPLTKAEVSGLSRQRIAVPTLALNTPDGDAAMPSNLYALTLNIEPEARAAAIAAYRADAGVAVIVTSGVPLAKRAAVAFADAWIKLGGSVKETIEIGGNLSQVLQVLERARGDVVFLATDAEKARLLRPYLGRNMLVIATSQVFAGVPRSDAQKPHDLNGLRFVDMPWLHQPDHAATMVFPRPEAPLAADLERLYALGIDAYRVAGELARARTEFTLDGVTGTLTVHAGVIQREPLQVEYRDGVVMPSPPR
jgi:outer membrane PBP1 activator LpoA protein